MQLFNVDRVSLVQLLNVDRVSLVQLLNVDRVSVVQLFNVDVFLRAPSSSEIAISQVRLQVVVDAVQLFVEDCVSPGTWILREPNIIMTFGSSISLCDRPPVL